MLTVRLSYSHKPQSFLRRSDRYTQAHFSPAIVKTRLGCVFGTLCLPASVADCSPHKHAAYSAQEWKAASRGFFFQPLDNGFYILLTPIVAHRIHVQRSFIASARAWLNAKTREQDF
jgi:hypothetical protein